MTDINRKTPSPPSNRPANVREIEPLRAILDHEILNLMELFYFAYRDFTAEGDEVLEKIGFGRAHHRIIHFVHHYPGLRVADLLNILKITKQSLAHVLQQLIDKGYIRRKEGNRDRRERRLYTTTKGDELAARLAAPQIEHVLNALADLPVNERETVENFLYSLVHKDHRHEVTKLFSQNGPLRQAASQPDEREDH